MENRLYFAERSWFQDAYFKFRLHRQPDYSFFPYLDGASHAYLAQYELMQGVLCRLHPFQFIEKGSTVVHVGFDRGYFQTGMSFPLVESALTGPDGTLIAIDPDQRNVEGLRSFCDQHNIGHIKTLHQAVWNEECEIELEFAEMAGPSSMTAEISKQLGDDPLKGARIKREVIRARRLDDIMEECLPGRKVDFLNMTVNGAEPEVIEGAEQIIADNPMIKIASAIHFGHPSFQVRMDLFDKLMQEGYDVAVSEAPHAPWLNTPFYCVCAFQNAGELFESKGYKTTSWDTIVEHSAIRARVANALWRRISRRILRKLAGRKTWW